VSLTPLLRLPLPSPLHSRFLPCVWLPDDEKKLIAQIFRNAIDSLSDDDKKLPQVENILPLLKRGIGTSMM
jgi:hypothetical protein